MGYSLKDKMKKGQLQANIEQLEEKTHGELEIYKVDVDDHPELCGLFNISSIPTLLFFKNGNLVFKELGFRSLDYLMEIIAKVKEAN